MSRHSSPSARVAESSESRALHVVIHSARLLHGTTRDVIDRCKQEVLMRQHFSVSCFSMTRHEFAVKMNCSGCSGAVTRVLTKLAGRVATGGHACLTKSHAVGVEKVECNLETQRVYVDSELPAETLLEKIQKTGKVWVQV